ncbi:MAG: transaldolase [Candidatus Binatia bacterium]
MESAIENPKSKIQNQPSPLLKLLEAGQSYWLDNLTRGMIRSGGLRKRVTEERLRGITSNPAIFNKAILKSRDYDAQIDELTGKGLPVQEIYEQIAIRDIQDACDLLRPVYDESPGEDGFVSLEVSPYLAHDIQGTIEEARRLFKQVNRPNVFIKIPGTLAGLPAIEQAFFEGINVNITLLFSVERYEAVALAYIRGMERRAAEGRPLERVASVASFFLSRIDVLVDQLLSHRVRSTGNGPGTRPEELLGKTGVANAKLAYQSFKRIFGHERWKVLEKKGARLQRPLWASTSTKNPRYADVMYVEPLIGRHTVNTMPEETIEAFKDHGIVTPDSVEENLDEARRIFGDLEQIGIDFQSVTWQLENEGVQKFIDPYAELLKTLAEKAGAEWSAASGQR